MWKIEESIASDRVESFHLFILIGWTAPLASSLYSGPSYPGCRVNSNAIEGSTLRAPPINAVRADCDSRCLRKQACSATCESRGSTAGLCPAPIKVVLILNFGMSEKTQKEIR